MHVLRNLILILAFFYFSEVSSQDSSPWDDVSISAHYHYGASIYTYSSFTLINNDYTRAFDLMIEKKTNGKNPWQSLYGYPTFGLGFFGTSLGNDEIHGFEYAVFPWFKYHIIDTRRFNFSSLFGLGVGYATKKYDSETNPYNVAVGSHWNIHFQANFMAQLKITDKWAIDAGLTFAHFSNGNSGEPNIGMNTVSLASGLSYQIGDSREQIKTPMQDADKRIFWEIGLAPGQKSSRALRQLRHFAISASGDLWKPLNHVFAIGIGPDLFYDSSAEIELIPNEDVDYSPRAEWSAGMHISLSVRYDKFRFILQGGAYMLMENLIFGNVMYNRAIFRYDIAKHFYVHFALKSHLEVLDYPEIGIGYRWKRD
jgi:hypothetical protein